jgi:hypothetical protein
MTDEIAKIINSYPIDNHLILQPAFSHQFLILNETAKIIWQSHERGLSRERICEALCQKYGISQEQAAQDVSSVFNWLESSGLFDNPANNVLVPANEDKEISARIPIYCEENPETGIQVGYSFNGQDFSIYYGNHQLKEHTHAFISPLEQIPATGNINVYQYAKYGNQLAVKRNGEVIALEQEEYQAQNILLNEIIADAYPNIQFGAIIHAAAVEKDGICILLPAPSGSGKSTLTAALLQAGFIYMGDDFIPLESFSFDALPIPFALSIKESSWNVLRKFYPELDTLPVFHRFNKTIKYLIPQDSLRVQSSQRMPVRCIIYPKYDPDTPTGIKEISAVKSFRNIIEAYSWIETDALCLARFVNWLQHTKSYTLSYANLADAVHLIEDLLST